MHLVALQHCPEDKVDTSLQQQFDKKNDAGGGALRLGRQL